MLKLSLDYLNYELENICNQYDFKRIHVHKRIKKIMITFNNFLFKINGVHSHLVIRGWLMIMCTKLVIV